MNFTVDYTPERHRAVEKIMTEMSADKDFPNNYNYMITIMGPKLPAFDGPKFFKEKIKAGQYDVITLSENDTIDLYFWFFALLPFDCLQKILFMPAY